MTDIYNFWRANKTHVSDKLPISNQYKINVSGFDGKIDPFVRTTIATNRVGAAFEQT